MNLLDRHIFKSVLGSCAAAVGLFAFVVALANFVRDLLGPVLAGELPTGMLVRLLLLLLPFAISYALPMGVLTGALLTLGRLSADSEITAMRAAGISVIRIARPVFLIGALGAATALYVNFESMPWARVQYHREFAEAVRTNPISFVVPRTFIRDFKGVAVYIGRKNSAGTVLHDIWVWKLDSKSRVTSMAHADSGRIDYVPDKNAFVLTLYGASLEERDDSNPEDFSKSPKVQQFDRLEEVRLSLDQYLGQDIFHVKPEWLRYGQLQARRAKLDAEKPAPGHEKEWAVRRMKLAMIVSEKCNLSLAAFAFAFIAVPMGIKISRRETSANLGIAVLLVLGYYVLLTAVKWLDQRPEYRPDLLLWVPNAIFLAVGARLIGRIQR